MKDPNAYQLVCVFKLNLKQVDSSRGTSKGGDFCETFFLNMVDRHQIDHKFITLAPLIYAIKFSNVNIIQS